MSVSLASLKDALKAVPAPMDALELLERIDQFVDDNAISRDAFVASKLGGVVKKVSEASEHSGSKTKAKQLMTKWKTQFASASASSGGDSAKKKPRVEEESSQDSPAPAPAPPAAAPRAAGLPMPADAKRQKLVKLLKDVFTKDDGLPDVITDRCIELERELHTLPAADFAAKYRLVKTQLPKNDELRQFLLHGEMECSELLKMTEVEMMPALERAASEKSLFNFSEAKRSDWADANRASILANAGVKDQTGFFKCGRCQSTKTAFYQKQTRGADEPMTVFVQCLDCKNRWKTEG